jgi:hypothetical protein
MGMLCSRFPIFLLSSLFVSGLALAGSVSFNRDVRPILSDKCFHCHGFDEKDRKGDLRLDLREAALKGGESGPAIVPGKPEASELLKRIVSKDADEVMPPPKMHKPVSSAEAAVLTQWIAEGAEYQGHWAFLKPERPVPPAAGNAIDAFIQQGLSKAGLKPSAEASKETLLRRVTLDLTGLPPTLAEVADFLNDPSPEAYEKTVDRILASPRYGEHMASRWLDMARYADSNGFQSDTSRQMWRWRQWLIEAFNKNLPFDQFTIQQIAGDMLPGATKEQIMATGFQRNHRLNGEGGRIVEEWFAETVIDRVETTGMTWLALTLNCCRCHDHKYDPITQKEFYQLFAYFNSVDEQGVLGEFGGNSGNRKGGNTQPVLDLPTPEQTKKLKALDQELKQAEAALVAAKGDGQFSQQWKPFAQETVVSKGGATMTRQSDGSWLASQANPNREVYEVSMPFSGKISGVLLECLPDPSLPVGSVGRHEKGNFVLSDVEVEIRAPEDAVGTVAMLERAEAEYSQKGWEVKNLVAKPDGKGPRRGWATDGNTRRKENRAMIAFAAPLEAAKPSTLTIRLRHDALDTHAIGRFRLSYSAAPKNELTVHNTSVKAAETKLEQVRKSRKELDSQIPDVMVLKELDKPRQAHVLNRGEYDKLGDKVERALPAALPGMASGLPNNRLGLAQWLVSGEHPLTGRVWVNRAWEHFFGTGIVKTSENFGSQAEWPSHPELLDWLATEFVAKKWDMKAMHRLMVTSATYKQDAKVTPEHLAKDADNRLLARAPRLRLSGESLRDQALYLSGLLVEKIGGPSVRPYMPAAVWDETSVYGDMRNYEAEKGEGLYRRTLYTVWKRTAAPPSMLLFDSPNREICTVKRSRSNTPTQALSLLNEITYVEAARKLAERMLLEGGAEPTSRLAWAFQHVVARKPSANELKVLLRGLETRLAKYQADPNAAAELLKQGNSPVAKDLAPAELAAYAVTANVLLNLDEVVTRE